MPNFETLKVESAHFVEMTEVDLWKLGYIIKLYDQKWCLAEQKDFGQWFFLMEL